MELDHTLFGGSVLGFIAAVVSCISGELDLRASYFSRYVCVNLGIKNIINNIVLTYTLLPDSLGNHYFLQNSWFSASAHMCLFWICSDFGQLFPLQTEWGIWMIDTKEYNLRWVHIQISYGSLRPSWEIPWSTILSFAHYLMRLKSSIPSWKRIIIIIYHYVS